MPGPKRSHTTHTHATNTGCASSTHPSPNSTTATVTHAPAAAWSLPTLPSLRFQPQDQVQSKNIATPTSCCMVTAHTSCLAIAYLRNFLTSFQYCLLNCDGKGS